MVFISGCSYGKIAKRNNELMLTLKIGQEKKEVLQVMGSPTKNETYMKNGKEIDIWFYRTSSFATDAWDSDNYFTPMVFEDGKLTGWGRDFYQQRIVSQFMLGEY